MSMRPNQQVGLCRICKVSDFSSNNRRNDLFFSRSVFYPDLSGLPRRVAELTVTPWAGVPICRSATSPFPIKGWCCISIRGYLGSATWAVHWELTVGNSFASLFAEFHKSVGKASYYKKIYHIESFYVLIVYPTGIEKVNTKSPKPIKRTSKIVVNGRMAEAKVGSMARIAHSLEVLALS